MNKRVGMAEEFCNDCWMPINQCECYDEFGCAQCGDGDPDSWESACFDDLCHGGEVPCMHGDYARLKCGVCGK